MLDLELIHFSAARLIHKLPKVMEHETVLINANCMILKYFIVLVWILNITHRAFYNKDLDDISSLVAKNASSYSLRKSLKLLNLGQKTELGRCSFKHSYNTYVVVRLCMHVCIPHQRFFDWDPTQVRIAGFFFLSSPTTQSLEQARLDFRPFWESGRLRQGTRSHKTAGNGAKEQARVAENLGKKTKSCLRASMFVFPVISKHIVVNLRPFRSSGQIVHFLSCQLIPSSLS